MGQLHAAAFGVRPARSGPALLQEPLQGRAAPAVSAALLPPTLQLTLRRAAPCSRIRPPIYPAPSRLPSRLPFLPPRPLPPPLHPAHRPIPRLTMVAATPLPTAAAAAAPTRALPTLPAPPTAPRPTFRPPQPRAFSPRLSSLPRAPHPSRKLSRGHPRRFHLRRSHRHERQRQEQTMPGAGNHLVPLLKQPPPRSWCQPLHPTPASDAA